MVLLYIVHRKAKELRKGFCGEYMIQLYAHKNIMNIIILLIVQIEKQTYER